MTILKSRSVVRLVCLLSLALAIAQLWTLGRGFLGRVAYPMDIEWMEGGSLYHAYRLLHHLSIYGAPSAGFAPYPYPPGHMLALAALGRIFGLGYATGRALSIASFLGATVLSSAVAVEPVGPAPRVHGGLSRFIPALLSAGVVASSFPFVETRWDLVRNDSLALFFVVAAACVASRAPTVVNALVVSLLAVAAVFTRQTNFFFALWLVVFAARRHFRNGAVLATAMGILAVSALAVAQVATHGWFAEWTLRNLAWQPVRWARLWDVHAVCAASPLAPLALGLGAWLAARRRLSSESALWLGMFGAAIPASLLPYAKVAGSGSDLSPLAILGPPVALRLGAEALAEVRGVARRAVAEVGALIALAVLLASRRYSSSSVIPSPELWRDARALIDQVRALPGGVLVPNHPFLPIEAGKVDEQFHDQGYQDALIAEMPGLDLPSFLARSSAEWVILSGSECAPVRGWIYQAFRGDRLLGTGVHTLVGYASEPSELLRRKKVLAKRNVRVLLDFESGLVGWRLRGNAFAVRGAPGERYLTSAAPPRGDAAVGVALSPAFPISREHLGMWVGGGASDSLSIEVVIDGAVAIRTRGVASDVMFEQSWDVRQYAGRVASLRLTDASRSELGHLLLARVYSFDTAPAGQGEPLPPSLTGPIGPSRRIRER